MSQEDIQPDSPQQGSNEQQYGSLEEAVFGTQEESNIESAFTNGNQGEKVEEAAPVATEQSVQTETPAQEVSNDEKRFQYWQSTADKLKNENEQLRNSLATQVQQPPQVAQPQEVAQPAEEEFPPPPDKPQRPRNFSREDAYADPNSDSARYLDAVEDWRDNIAEYNTVKVQYDNALVQERFETMEAQRIENAKKAQAYQAEQAQMQNVKSHVMGAHGLSEQQAVDFMQKMSDPKSLNIDNLVQLYQMQTGGAAPQNTAPAQPSANFKQVQNAQQVPSPMGVMPSGNANNDGRNVEDKIMDTIIGNFNSKNPWK